MPPRRVNVHLCAVRRSPLFTSRMPGPPSVAGDRCHRDHPGTHMRESFGAALHEVGNLLVTMAEAARTQMRQATYALLTADKEAAETVVARDEEINGLYRKVEE